MAPSSRCLRFAVATHKESYLDIAMVAIVGAIVALAAVIVLGTLFGLFDEEKSIIDNIARQFGGSLPCRSSP